MDLDERFDNTRPASGQIVTIVTAPAHREQAAGCRLFGKNAQPVRRMRVGLHRKLQMRNRVPGDGIGAALQ
jgi:hypothetical protein